MQILCITHADFETPGVISDWADLRGHQMTVCKPFAGENLEHHPIFDWLIIMGGPQSPLSIDKSPYLQDEIEFIDRTISLKKPVLGFCLGAQLIGEALKARTERSPEKEIGVYPIFLTDSGKSDPILKNLGPFVNAIHWHNDMPGLTHDAVVLAKSGGCPRQIVRYADLVYGFQCHLEITLQGIETMIKACPDDLRISRFTQTAAELLENDYQSIHSTMFEVLDNFSHLIENDTNQTEVAKRNTLNGTSASLYW